MTGATGATGNPFDQARVRDDVVRYEYAEKLFAQVYALHKEFEAEPLDVGETEGERKAHMSGIRFVMDLLDEEMGRLRDAWS